jgi:acyl-CoA thioester hydrolase
MSALIQRKEAMLEILANYPVIIETPVAWGEMDALGHVNNVAYFRYLESSRVAYLDRLKIWDYMEETGLGPILASVQCRYRIPLVYPDTLSIGARTTKIEKDRFLVEHSIVSHKLRKVAAEGSGVLVVYDYRQKRKALMPDYLKARIEAIEEGAKKA